MAKSYLESWKKAKDRFEKATGKKKPDPKSRFGKLFSKISSTGLESALKSYDAAKTVKDAQKHARAFKTAASSYIPTLDTAGKAAKQDGDAVYAEACADMVASLNKIAGNVTMDLERFDDLPKDLDGFFKSPYWFKLLQKQAKKEYSLENIELYDMILKRKLSKEDASEKAYKDYVELKSPKEVNIKSATRKSCKQIADQGKWKAMPWDDVAFDLAENLCDTVVRLQEAIATGEA
ncbi:hypothetical protein JJL56_15360 [Azospirillum sp. YIM DDC1]|uniref:BAR domain-containing protein n=1 Tax=Azospirillum aestuarii TaxID=2802052 RepID=A0ABS1I0Q6_9PROT|nr:hypothetical protein [Azospirillum aestuarii]MBK4720248.1 hypothetical protein [Azospirillum aestuarii]TWA88330.1 hypothetical protein FBY14_10888 [Azospirillum brasilense]